MPATRPTLARAFLVGSLRHFLAGVAVPAAVAGAAVALHNRSLAGEAFWMMLALSSAALGALFVFHEAVVLIAVAWWRRRPPADPGETDVATDLLSTVIGWDLAAVCLLVAILMWFEVRKIGELALLLVLFLPALYGVHLLARCVGAALSEPDAPSGTPRGRVSRGLQAYVTIVVATLAFAAFGWQQDVARTFAIALVSIAAGHIVAAAAARWSNPRSP